MNHAIITYFSAYFIITLHICLYVKIGVYINTSRYVFIVNIYTFVYIYNTFDRKIYMTHELTNQKIIDEMKIVQNWGQETTKQMNNVLKSYTTFQKKSFNELLEEAEEDEQEYTKVQKRRIKKRLLNYIIYLRERNFADSTIRTYIAKIKQIYVYHCIEIPPLPRIIVQQKESYDDLPTHEEIKTAIEHSRTKMKAVITFLASSGLRRSDLVKLTIRDFFNATKEYNHHVITSYDITQGITVLSQQDNIIPSWHITSEKTNIQHITFNSSECTRFILQMLRERGHKKELHLEDSLFELGEVAVTVNFQRLNDRLDFGWKERRRKFHAHSMRKFFATTLTTNDVDFLSTEFLLGHHLSSMQSSYYFAHEEKLKLKYQRVMSKLIFVSLLYEVDLVSSEHRELSRLRDENRETRRRLYELEEMIDMIRERENI